MAGALKSPATKAKARPVAAAEPSVERAAVAKSGDPYQLQSLDRAVALLELLGESEGPLGLSDVCERMSLHKSTAHRALMVLERCGLIERTVENRFRLGLKLYELGSRAVEQIDLRARVHPWFRRLSAQVGETVHLGVLQKTSVVYLDKIDPVNRRVWLASRIGSSNPVYCTAMGKAMLAFLPEAAAADILSRIRFTRFTARTLCTPEALLRSLDRVRRRGYAIDDEEVEAGVRCVGAPILNESGYPMAAVSVSGPTSRITQQSVPGIAEHLLRCCREISASLGVRERRKPQTASPFLQHYGV
ncbi:MAG: IclR family transcriptional regulator [Acidobacteriaceae bacterium]